MTKVRFVLAFGVFAGSPCWAQSDPQLHMLRACAAYDLRAMTVLEEAGQSVSSDSITVALDALIRARSACTAGRHVQGLSIYETIAVKPMSVANPSVAPLTGLPLLNTRRGQRRRAGDLEHAPQAPWRLP
jgi:hypothetical protein